jgi:homoserine dehydrogenase
MAQTFLTPPASPASSGDTYESTFSPTSSTLQLPPPPVSTDSRQQEVAKRIGMVEYYWPRHFEKNPVDPAAFFDRVMTDYAYHDTNIVGVWIDDKNTLYKLYKACLEYGCRHGTPNKSLQAKQYKEVFFIVSDN